MALFSTKSHEPVETKQKEKDEEVTLDDILDEIDALMSVIKAQTKLIQELSTDLTFLKKDLGDFKKETDTKLSENLNAQSKLNVVEYKFSEMVSWVQEQFVSLLGHTKEKAAEPKVNPAVKAYLEKKNGTATGKLPLP